MVSTGKMWNRYFISLLILEVCIQVATFTTRPLVANYAVTLGASLAAAGFIGGLNKGTALLLRPFSGYLSDRIPKKTSLIVASLAYVVSTIGCALATDAFIVGAFCAMQGISLAFQSVSVISLVALALPPDRTGSGVGLIGLVNTLAMAVGPALGTYIGRMWDYTTCFYAAAVLYLIGLILAVTYQSPESAAKAAANKDKGQAKEADEDEVDDEQGSAGSKLLHILRMAFYLPSVPYALTTILTVCGHTIMSVLILTVDETGYLENGALYFTVYAIVAMAARPVAGRMTDTYGVLAIATPGFLLAAAGMLELTVFHSTIAVVVAGLCMGLGQASGQCALQAESVRGVDPDHVGRAANTYYFGADAGGALAPMAGGFILQVASPTELFLFNACTALLGLAILIALTARRKKKQRSASE